VGRWYAAEFIGDASISKEDTFSPFKVLGIIPKGGGKREFVLEFIHVNRSVGERTEKWLMQTIERGKKFILARSLNHESSAILKITEIRLDVAELGEAWRASGRKLDAIADQIYPSIGEYPTRYKAAYHLLDEMGLDMRPFMDHAHDVLDICGEINAAFQAMRDAPSLIHGHESPESFETYPPIYGNLQSRIGEAFVMFENR